MVVGAGECAVIDSNAILYLSTSFLQYLFAGAVLDAIHYKVNPSQSAMKTTFVEPCQYWPETTLNASLLRGPRVGGNGSVPDPDDDGPLVYRSMVRPDILEEWRLNQPTLYQKIYPDPEPAAEALAKPLFSEIMQRADLVATAQEARNLYSNNLGPLTEDQAVAKALEYAIADE